LNHKGIRAVQSGQHWAWLLRVERHTTSHRGDRTEALVGGDEYTDLSALAEIESDSELQGVQSAKSVGNSVSDQEPSCAVKMTFNYRWRDQEPLLRQVSPKAPPGDFHRRFVNLPGSHFDCEDRFHLYNRQVRDQ